VNASLTVVREAREDLCGEILDGEDGEAGREQKRGGEAWRVSSLGEGGRLGLRRWRGPRGGSCFKYVVCVGSWSAMLGWRSDGGEGRSAALCTRRGFRSQCSVGSIRPGLKGEGEGERADRVGACRASSQDLSRRHGVRDLTAFLTEVPGRHVPLGPAAGLRVPKYKNTSVMG